MIIMLLIVLAVVFYILIDFYRFTKTKKVEGYQTDAGGVLFVQGGKTYYQMPKGERRKIADYPFDLTHNSSDMKMFLGVMGEAKKEAHKESTDKKRAAVKAVKELAQ